MCGEGITYAPESSLNIEIRNERRWQAWCLNGTLWGVGLSSRGVPGTREHQCPPQWCGSRGEGFRGEHSNMMRSEEGWSWGNGDTAILWEIVCCPSRGRDSHVVSLVECFAVYLIVWVRRGDDRIWREIRLSLLSHHSVEHIIQKQTASTYCFMHGVDWGTNLWRKTEPSPPHGDISRRKHRWIQIWKKKKRMDCWVRFFKNEFGTNETQCRKPTWRAHEPSWGPQLPHLIIPS